MSIGANLGTVLHQLDFLSSFSNLNFIDYVVEGSSIDSEITEPAKIGSEWSLSRVGIDTILVDVDDRGVSFLDEGLNITLVMDGIDLKVVLVLWKLQNLHPDLHEIRLLFGENMDGGIGNADQSVATRLVYSSAPQEVWVLDEGVLLI
jgi:hypothetical protein